jgi:hypothetical protein
MTNATEILRTPFFVVALVMALIIVLLELGSSSVLHFPGNATQNTEVCAQTDCSQLDAEQQAQLANLAGQPKPPGKAIPFMALLDGLMLFTCALMGASMLIGERLHGRIQGILSLLVSIAVVLGGIALLILAFVFLLLMLGLIGSFFGIIVYVALYGFFNRSEASILLGILTTLKIGFLVCLLIANQRFLQNLRLMFLVLTSFLANLIISILHGFVPQLLVSITDAIAAIVIAILAIVWGFIFLIYSLPSIIRSIRASG